MPNKVLRLHFASPTEIAVECDQTNDSGISLGKIRTRASVADAPAGLQVTDLFAWVQSEVDRQVATLPANTDIALITGKLHVARELSADIAQKTQYADGLSAKAAEILARTASLTAEGESVSENLGTVKAELAAKTEQLAALDAAIAGRVAAAGAVTPA